MEVEADDEGDNYFLSLPAGYWFEPTDTELVVHYLYNKVSNKPLPRNRIRDVNIYLFHPQQLAQVAFLWRVTPLRRGTHSAKQAPIPLFGSNPIYTYLFHPQQLVRMYPLLREIHWYFFTPRERIFTNGVRRKRSTSDGYGKQTVHNKHIMYEKKIVGYKMSLDFYEGGHRDGRRTEWKMHEYRIHKNSPPPPKIINASDSMKLDDWVLCKLYSTSITAEAVQENQRAKLAAASFPDLYRLSSGDNDKLDDPIYIEGVVGEEIPQKIVMPNF